MQIGAALLSWRRTNPDGQASAANMAPEHAQNCQGAGRRGRGSPPGGGAETGCPHVDIGGEQPRLRLGSELEVDWREEGRASSAESGTKFVVHFA